MIWQLSGPTTYAKGLQGVFLFVGILTVLTGSETFVLLLTRKDRRKLRPGYLHLCTQNGDYSVLPWQVHIALTPRSQRGNKSPDKKLS